ncbi:MAG: hypothetical protein JXP34_10015 [Planctomycetes bacterium]|nr:hypothetical protein [Planctomycetota bacterium]
MRTQPLLLAAGLAVIVPSGSAPRARGAEVRYYAHPAVEDRNGVIAPWYKGLNGPCDLRVRIAAETLKRYPWTDPAKVPIPAPDYMYNGHWKIAPDGTIEPRPLSNWANGDFGQRAAFTFQGFLDYYRYAGDPAAIAHIALFADLVLAIGLTPEDHPWPRFPVSAPTRGKPYGRVDPRGFIQLDIAAEMGIGIVGAHRLTGEPRYREAAEAWARLFAAKRNRAPNAPPWNRYANPEDVAWEDYQTGGAILIIRFLDEVIRLQGDSPEDELVEAREAGIAYLRDTLLPAWTVQDTFARHYWDWPHPFQGEITSEAGARTIAEHPEIFPNWKADARNVMTLFIHRACAATGSGGGVFHGAWAFPEGPACCGRSLWYAPLQLGWALAEYGARADSEWARELARRIYILNTYDVHETGVVEDGIDGGPVVAANWFKIAHPMALAHVLAGIAWMPETLGAPRENHIVRSTSTVTRVTYGKGRIAYATFDAPPGTIDVLRLSFRPQRVAAGGIALAEDPRLAASGFAVHPLPGGDAIAAIRHDGAREVIVEGDDPQRVLDAARILNAPGDGALEVAFDGHQVRAIGSVEPDGGIADVYLDGTKQLAGIDAWNPYPIRSQVLWYRNGLANGRHTVRIVARGEGNPHARGTRIAIEAVQVSAAAGEPSSGEGGGPRGPQRWILGYPEREDYIDRRGRAWRPATEVVLRTGDATEVTSAWYTRPRRWSVIGTEDPALYAHGMHGREFTAYVTVGPGTYGVRLKFMEHRDGPAAARAIDIAINGKTVASGFDIAATAGGRFRAVDLVFDGIEPARGVIAIRFAGSAGGEAIASAIEIGPGPAGEGATPVCIPAPPPAAAGNLLRNGGFEDGLPGEVGALGARGGGTSGWSYLFAGPSRSYIFPESAYSIHPEWGPPVIHGGKEALRTHSDGGGHTIVYQEVEAKPATAYRASVWIRADDLHGKGFGAGAGDGAGLWIQEIDRGGALVADHGKRSVTKAGDFTEISCAFTTGEKTAKIRFILDAAMACRYDEGHVTYDDAHLAQE